MMTKRQFLAAADKRGQALFAGRKTGGCGGFDLSSGMGRYIEAARRALYRKDGKRRAGYLTYRGGVLDLAYELYRKGE